MDDFLDSDYYNKDNDLLVDKNHDENNNNQDNTSKIDSYYNKDGSRVHNSGHNSSSLKKSDFKKSNLDSRGQNPSKRVTIQEDIPNNEGGGRLKFQSTKETSNSKKSQKNKSSTRHSPAPSI